MKAVHILVIWVSLNVLGFWIGWNVGGNDFGSRGLHAAARNLFYGGAFGGAQMLALWVILRPNNRRLLSWPLATSLSFALGVRLWKVWRVPKLDWLGESYRLGTVVCVVIGLAQSLVLLVTFPNARHRLLGMWFAADAASWIVLEHLSATRGWEGVHILMAVAPASVLSGLMLVVVTTQLRRDAGRAPTTP